MRRGMVSVLIFGFTLMALIGVALAQYRSTARGKEEPEGESFEESVDLERFRTGTDYEWNTQRLISSGLTALHKEHLKILKEMEDLRKEIAQLKGKK